MCVCVCVNVCMCMSVSLSVCVKKDVYNNYTSTSFSGAFPLVFPTLLLLLLLAELNCLTPAVIEHSVTLYTYIRVYTNQSAIYRSHTPHRCVGINL